MADAAAVTPQLDPTVAWMHVFRTYWEFARTVNGVAMEKRATFLRGLIEQAKERNATANDIDMYRAMLFLQLVCETNVQVKAILEQQLDSGWVQTLQFICRHACRSPPGTTTKPWQQFLRTIGLGVFGPELSVDEAELVRQFFGSTQRLSTAEVLSRDLQLLSQHPDDVDARRRMELCLTGVASPLKSVTLVLARCAVAQRAFQDNAVAAPPNPMFPPHVERALHDIHNPEFARALVAVVNHTRWVAVGDAALPQQRTADRLLCAEMQREIENNLAGCRTQ